jgi:hypothetical protein
MARTAESLGYEGVFVTDHPIPPEKFIRQGGHHAFEPTVVLAVAAGATTRLRLMTNLFIIGYRNPFLAAKAIASLDSLVKARLNAPSSLGEELRRDEDDQATCLCGNDFREGFAAFVERRAPDLVKRPDPRASLTMPPSGAPDPPDTELPQIIDPVRIIGAAVEVSVDLGCDQAVNDLRQRCRVGVANRSRLHSGAEQVGNELAHRGESRVQLFGPVLGEADVLLRHRHRVDPLRR